MCHFVSVLQFGIAIYILFVKVVSLVKFLSLVEKKFGKVPFSSVRV